MLLSPPPSFLLNHRHAQTSPILPDFLLPLSSPLSYHIVIIYPHSYNSLFMPPFISPYYTLIPLLLTPSFYPHSSSSPSSPLSHTQCPIGGAIQNLHMIVINGFDLFARLSLHPPFTLSLSRPRRFQCGSPQQSGLSVFIN